MSAATAAEVCARADLSLEALAGVKPGLTPQCFLAELVRSGHHADALRFLAHALPAREGVWWACVVAGAAPLTDAEAVCLDRAEDWVYEPSDAARRRCSTAAEASTIRGAAAYASLGASWSGGSLAPDGMPAVPPPPRLASVGVAASLLLALAAGDPTLSGDRFRDMLSRGLDIADGGNGRKIGDRPRGRAAGTAS